MTLHYSDDSIQLHHGDCLDVLRTLPDASVDAIVTDPPYGLAELPARTVAAALTAWLTGDREHVPDGKGFMGREWDKFVPPPAVWDECLRVLKPGGHLLAFAGSRTADLMGMSIRLAGFEIRDGIDWLSGSGFPKSLDLSKAIDKGRRRDYVLAAVELGLTIPGNNLHDWTKAEHSPGDTWWERFKAHIPAADWQRIERKVVGERTTGRGTGRGAVAYIGDSENRDVTAPATDDARRWAGWGTALKPAREPIVVARKPIGGTVAANVLRYGTGALNIDACRVGDGGQLRWATPRGMGSKHSFADDTWPQAQGRPHADATASAVGRWPTNVVLSHAGNDADGDLCADGCMPGCPVADLDAQSGILTSGANPTRRGSDKFREAYGEFKGQAECVAARGADSGGASRFFPVFRYEAKAPTSERPNVDGTAHATVKPLALMRWLVQLVTPPGGTVLEPFAGSGTTVEACLIENFQCIAIEREADYLPLIMARISKPITPTLFGEFLGGVA